jgi:hypothetical protein
VVPGLLHNYVILLNIANNLVSGGLGTRLHAFEAVNSRSSGSRYKDNSIFRGRSWDFSAGLPNLNIFWALPLPHVYGNLNLWNPASGPLPLDGGRPC